MTGRRKNQDPERVSMGDCRCPGTPHGEDVAWMSMEKAARAWQAAYKSHTPETPEPDIIVLEAAVLGGLVAWNLIDAQGEPLPLHEAVNDFAKGWRLAAWFQARVWDMLDRPIWRVGGISLGEADRGDGDDDDDGKPN